MTEIEVETVLPGALDVSERVRLVRPCSEGIPSKKCIRDGDNRSVWNLPPRLIAGLRSTGGSVLSPKGSVVFAEGHKALSVYVIRRGQVKVVLNSPYGRPLLIRVAHAGDILGLSAVLSKSPYDVTAVVKERAELLKFEGSNFVKFILQNIEGSLWAVEALNCEYRSTLDDVFRLGMYNSVIRRLAHLLFALGSEIDPSSDGPLQLRISLTHEELASMLGSSRESVTRAMKILRDDGVVRVRAGRITILQMGALREML